MPVITVGLTGAHHTGKSTTAAYLAEMLRPMKIDSRVIVRSGGDCPLPLNRAASPETQIWMREAHLGMDVEETVLKEASRDRRLVLIRDRTRLDWNVYSSWLNANSPTREWRGKFVEDRPEDLKAALERYDLLLWCRPDGRRVRAEGKRDESLKWQREIDKLFEAKLAALGVKAWPIKEPVAAYRHVLDAVRASQWI